MPTWRYSVGRKGVSRVTVFERPDATSIFVEWWDEDGRHKASLARLLGKPVTERERAMEVARRMSAAQERRRNQEAAELLGLPSGRTLLDLLQTMHMDRGAEWSDSYRRDQDRYRKVWEEKLGAIKLTGVTAAVVERIAREVYPKKVASRRHLLRYIVDAFYYAERKLKWIEPRHNLSAVAMPKRQRKSLAYSLEEAKALLPALERADWRAGFIGQVAFQTGRRLTAIRTLPEQDGWVTFDDGNAVLHFPAETDKARQAGEAVIVSRAVELAQRAAKKWVTPTMEECQDWLKAAETAAEIPYRKGRSWHGLKRLWATLAKGHPAREKQGGTTGQTLDRVYEQDHREPKVDLAKKLAGRLAGQ